LQNQLDAQEASVFCANPYATFGPEPVHANREHLYRFPRRAFLTRTCKCEGEGDAAVISFEQDRAGGAVAPGGKKTGKIVFFAQI